MTSWKSISAAAAVLLLLPGVCHGLVETCEDLQAAFELTNTQDVEVEMEPFADIECATFTNMTMSSNKLTVSSSEEMDEFSGSVNLIRVRIDVTNGAKLTWETNVIFDGVEGEDENNVDGGAVFVGEGSTVRFLNDLEMTDVGIINETDEDSDFASFVRSGGCVWTNGYFRVDGAATFTRCESQGAGESPPGPGGAVYVGEMGSVLFNEGVVITETSIADDGGNEGGGIYNLGKVNIKGENSRFEEIRANSGAAIYNGENAKFMFKNGAKAFFRDVSNRDSFGSALFNRGYFTFAGPALFVDTDAPVIVAEDSSETILSENSAFWNFNDPEFEDEAQAEALSISDSAEFTIPSSVVFIGYEELGF